MKDIEFTIKIIGHPYLEGWAGTENREHNPENAVWEEVRFISYSKRYISYK